jgi:large conductance mechanosensitive channel
MLKEFKEFALKGNVLDMAVGIIIGGAFGTIVKNLVDDIIMPPIGLILAGIDFKNFFILLKAGKTPPPYLSLTEAKEAGSVTLNYGLFINSCISFLIVVFCVFLLVKMVNKLHQEEQKVVPAPQTKECPFCFFQIHLHAARCPHCTSNL